MKFVIENGVLKAWEKPTVLEIPNGVEEIGEEAFAYEEINSVIFPDTVKIFRHRCFSGCEDLTSFVFPSSTEIIESSVVAFCRNLTSIEIKSNNIKKIDPNAFWNCPNLEKIKFPYLKNIEDLSCIIFLCLDKKLKQVQYNNTCFYMNKNFKVTLIYDFLKRFQDNIWQGIGKSKIIPFVKMLVYSKNLYYLKEVLSIEKFKSLEVLQVAIDTATEENNVELLAFLMRFKSENFNFSECQNFEL